MDQIIAFLAKIGFPAPCDNISVTIPKAGKIKI
jgi:hypothetical protein